MKKISKKHYFKLIAFLVILSSVPVIVTGGLSYWQSSKAIVDYSNEEKKQNIYQIHTNVEQALRYIDLSTTYFLRSPQTREFLNEEMNADAFSEFHKLRKDLNHLQTLETGIEDIILVSLEKKWLVNNDGLQHLDKKTYEQLNTHYLNTDQPQWLLEEADRIQLPNATKKSCSHYINLIKKLPITSSSPEGIVSVLVPACELNNIMAESNDEESFIILDKNNQTIAHSNVAYTGEDGYIPNALFDKINRSETDGQFEHQINGVDYKVSYQTSDYSDWSYLSLVKLSDLHSKSSSIGWITALIVSILLIISLCFAIISGRLLYKPVQKLKNAIQLNSQADDAGKGNEFDLIETHIEKLLNHNNQLEKRVQNQVTQLKQLFMIRLLQGKVVKSEIPIKVNAFDYNQNWNWITVFSLKIDAIDQGKFNKNDQDLILFAINNLIEDLIPQEERFSPVVINDTQSTLFIHADDKEAAYTHEMNQKAKYLQKKIKELFHLSVSIGISKRHSSLEEAKVAYKESKEALKYRLKMGEESIIFYENLDRRYSSIAPYPSAIKNKIFDAIKLSNKEVATEEIAKLFHYIKSNDIHHQQLEIILSRFLYELYELKELIGVNVEGFQSTDMITHYQQFGTLEDIQSWLSDRIILPLIDNIDARDESKNKKVSDKMLSIIHRNFDKDISLDLIAAELHYNPNYLSGIFQKELGYSFSEYLLRYRLNKAKEWLTTTSMSVKEIAEKLHYNNSQNFIRSFRKMEGVTPGKYRTQYKQKEA